MEMGFIILLALAIPIVIIWPLLIWTGTIRSIYHLARSRMRGKATADDKNNP